jgi:ribosomal protein S18 acetylase RimI-like enzyme
VIEKADIDAVVEVHMIAFKGFFLTLLGASFLRELYKGILIDPSGFGFVAEQNGVAGFVAGTCQPAGFYTRLIKTRLLRFAVAAIKPLLKNPRIIFRLFRALAMPAENARLEGYGLLMSLAVMPAYQGQKMGQALVQRFLDEAQNRGLRGVILTTDKLNNDGVNRFYQNLGFRISRSFITPENREMNEYLFEFQNITHRK